jgi:hypothetical protein
MVTFCTPYSRAASVTMEIFLAPSVADESTRTDSSLFAFKTADAAKAVGEGEFAASAGVCVAAATRTAPRRTRGARDRFTFTAYLGWAVADEIPAS